MSGMNMQDFFRHLAEHPGRGGAPLPDKVVQGFVRMLEEVRIEDMPCSQVFARLDEYVEREIHGEDVTRLMPLLREHLDLCHDCCEEYEGLMAVLEQSSSKEQGGRV
jgi:hypothetical protein